jgi:hypothetical protein
MPDITVREPELLVRALKHAVKKKRQVGERFRNHPLDWSRARKSHLDADVEIEKAEENLLAACRGLTSGGLSISRVTEDEEDNK